MDSFHELKFRHQESFVGFFFFFENLKILGIKEPWGFFDFAKHIPKRIGNFHEIIKFRDQGSFVGFFFFFFFLN